MEGWRGSCSSKNLRFVYNSNYSGGCSPGDHSPSLMCEPVSAWRAWGSNSRCSICLYASVGPEVNIPNQAAPSEMFSRTAKESPRALRANGQLSVVAIGLRSHPTYSREARQREPADLVVTARMRCQPLPVAFPVQSALSTPTTGSSSRSLGAASKMQPQREAIG
jgi:hypothetical protein